MLCEKCLEREAAVHLTVVTPDRVLQRREYCDACALTPDEMKEEALRTFLSDKQQGELPGEESNDKV